MPYNTTVIIDHIKKNLEQGRDIFITELPYSFGTIEQADVVAEIGRLIEANRITVNKAGKVLEVKGREAKCT